MYSYTYSITNDLGTYLNIDQLTGEIQEQISTLAYIKKVDDNAIVTFTAELSTEDAALLAAVIAAYSPVYLGSQTEIFKIDTTCSSASYVSLGKFTFKGTDIFSNITNLKTTSKISAGNYTINLVDSVYGTTVATSTFTNTGFQRCDMGSGGSNMTQNMSTFDVQCRVNSVFNTATITDLIIFFN